MSSLRPPVAVEDDDTRDRKEHPTERGREKLHDPGDQGAHQQQHDVKNQAEGEDQPRNHDDGLRDFPVTFLMTNHELHNTRLMSG